MKKSTDDNQPRIGIIGGGAAGLSAGYFLKQQGYKNVTILEKENRVGGKCLSITVGGKSFDLGANYITSSYKEVQKLARIFGANMYTEGNLRAYNNPAEKFSSLFKAVTKDTSIFKLGWESLRYLFKRWQLNRYISPKRPGYKGIAKHPALTQSFEQWLLENNFPNLATLFEVPIALMGYGKLKEIPAAYALTYMTTNTFLDLSLAAVNPHIRGYPKRFTEGYERLWDRVSWELDVIVGAKVTKVTRGEEIKVEYNKLEEHLGHVVPAKQELTFDYLFVGVPLYEAALDQFLDQSEEERNLFKQVVYDPFIVTTYDVPGLEDFTAATFMIPEPEVGQPFVVTRQFENNNLVSIYTRTVYGQKIDKATILANNAAFVKKSCNVDLGAYYSYSEFPYFPHVPQEAFANGFYDQLANLQGKKNTFFVGGLMNFELVETITNYSKHLVKNHFAKIK
ncbi:MAG: FAD-dependent oxidoreductase [Bacteroidota bacterium]